MTWPLQARGAALEAPPVPAGWRLLATLVPRDRGTSPQGLGVMGDGSWISSQGDAHDNVTLTRYHRRSDRLDELRILGAGHGDRLTVDGKTVGLFVRGVWCEIPWRTGTMAAAEALEHRSSYRIPFGARSWFQGEILDLDGVLVRLYGVPFRGYGPSIVDGVKRPNLPARLEFYRPGSSSAYRLEHIPQLGRDADGKPYGDRLEPEGLSVGQVDDRKTLLVGIVNGRAGHDGFTHRVYGRTWQGPPS